MEKEVLVAKQIFTIGEQFSNRTDPVSAGVAISLFQDSVEHLLVCIAKHQELDVGNQESFPSLLKKVSGIEDHSIPYRKKILALNRARISFKHHGELPTASESGKYRTYTYEFLTAATLRYLGIDFESVSLASLIADKTIRDHAQNAEELLAEQEIEQSIAAVAHARYFLFRKLRSQLPQIGAGVRDMGKAFSLVRELRGLGTKAFDVIALNFEEQANFNAIAIAGGSISEHLHFEKVLPHVTQFEAGNTRLKSSHLVKQTPELAESAIKYVVETAIRVEGLL